MRQEKGIAAIMAVVVLVVGCVGGYVVWYELSKRGYVPPPPGSSVGQYFEGTVIINKEWIGDDFGVSFQNTSIEEGAMSLYPAWIWTSLDGKVVLTSLKNGKVVDRDTHEINVGWWEPLFGTEVGKFKMRVLLGVEGDGDITIRAEVIDDDGNPRGEALTTRTI